MDEACINATQVIL